MPLVRRDIQRVVRRFEERNFVVFQRFAVDIGVHGNHLRIVETVTQRQRSIDHRITVEVSRQYLTLPVMSFTISESLLRHVGVQNAKHGCNEATLPLPIPIGLNPALHATERSEPESSLARLISDQDWWRNDLRTFCFAAVILSGVLNWHVGIVRSDIGFGLTGIRPEWNGELLRSGLKLSSHRAIGNGNAGLKECCGDERVFHLIGGKLRRNDYVCNLCLSHLANLESK